MQEVLNIINSSFLDKFSKLFSKPKFYGNIYSIDNVGNLNIDRNTLNYLINKLNTAYKELYEVDDTLITLDDTINLIFLNEYFKKSESIWVEDRNYYRCAILTDYGIVSLFSEETNGFNKSPDDIKYIVWKETDNAELFQYNDSNEYFIRFFEKNGTSETDIPLNRFGTKDKKSAVLLVALFNQINNYVSENLLKSNSEKEEIENTITESIEKGEFKKMNDLLENYSNMYDVNDPESFEFPFYYKNKSIALENLGEYDDALFTINKMIELSDEIDIASPNAHKIKGDILLKKGETLKAINSYAYSEENFTEVSQIKAISALKQNAYEKVKNDFVDIPYDKRKLIFASNNIYNTVKNDLVLVKKNEIPNGLNFPIGHPHINEVYTCHPLKNDFYLPLKDFQQDLFYDRVNEFTYLLQCLGATKIEISSSKNNSIEQNEKLNSNLDIKASNKITDAKVNIQNNSTKNNLADKKLKIEKVQTFTPTKAPHIPSNLIWYKTDMSWQRLAEQRLNGNISQHKEKITSIQNEIISNQEISNINAELRLLLPKVNVQYAKEHEINVNSKTSFEWIISVEFENTDLLETVILESNTEKLTENINVEKYREDVQFMLEDDNIIDENERKILNRKVKKYGLTEEEATKVENEVMSNHFSKSELLYIEELKDILEDGEITEVESKMLDRYAKKFGLDNETKEKIDSIFK